MRVIGELPESSVAKLTATPSFCFTFVAAIFTPLRFLKSQLIKKLLLLNRKIKFITAVNAR